MSDWTFLEKHRVTKAFPGVPPQYATDSTWGFCGMFRFPLQGRYVRCVVSDGAGWQHVSVSIEGDRRTPTWEMMCRIKELFWDDEDVVMQLHPKKSEYVNMHPGCLHLWKPMNAEIPTPDSLMVGIKGVAPSL